MHDLLDCSGSRAEQATRPELPHSVARLFTGSSEVASASWDRAVRIWDVASGHLKITLAGRDSSVLAATYSVDGTILVTGDRGGQLVSWIVSPDVRGPSFTDSPDPLSLAFVPGKTQLLLSGGDPLMDRPGGYLHLWSCGTTVGHEELGSHAQPITSVAVTPDGRWLAAGSTDGLVRLWELASRREVRRLGPHSGYVWSVVFSPDGSRLASAGGDKQVRLWDVATGNLIATMEGHAATIEQVAFDASGQQLASADWERSVIVWSADNGTELWRITQKSKGSAFVAFSASGTVIAAHRESSFASWLPGRKEPVSEFRGHSARVTAIGISPDFRTLASADENGIVRLWDPERGQERAMFQAHNRPIAALGFSSDSQTLATADSGGEVRTWLSSEH